MRARSDARPESGKIGSPTYSVSRYRRRRKVAGSSFRDEGPLMLAQLFESV